MARRSPETTQRQLMDTARSIEPWAKKASKEMEKGSRLGIFYNTVVMILVSLLILAAIGVAVALTKLLPEEYRYFGWIFSIVLLIILIYFMWNSMKKQKRKHPKR